MLANVSIRYFIKPLFDIKNASSLFQYLLLEQLKLTLLLFYLQFSVWFLLLTWKQLLLQIHVVGSSNYCCQSRLQVSVTVTQLFCRKQLLLPIHFVLDRTYFCPSVFQEAVTVTHPCYRKQFVLPIHVSGSSYCLTSMLLQKAVAFLQKVYKICL